MIKYIYFDFGGVLVNYDKALQGVCRDFGLNFDEFIKFKSSFEEEITLGKITTEEFWKKCIDKFNLKNAESYDLPKSWVSDYVIIKPVNELIYSLENKIDMGIISNINSGVWEAALKDEWVPVVNYKNVLLSYKLGCEKPNSEIYELAQKEAGVNPEEILLVDDKEENMVEPRRMGWEIFVFNQFQAEEGAERIKEILDLAKN